MATNQAQSLNHNSLERFGFSGHETFPFRYGWLKKAVDAVTKNKFLFSTEQALVELGVGKNMVQSIRHWGLATQVLLEGEGRSLELSPIGWRLFMEWDPHLENPASLWLTQNLHLLHSLHKPAFPLTSSGGGCQRPGA